MSLSGSIRPANTRVGTRGSSSSSGQVPRVDAVVQRADPVRRGTAAHGPPAVEVADRQHGVGVAVAELAAAGGRTGSAPSAPSSGSRRAVPRAAVPAGRRRARRAAPACPPTTSPSARPASDGPFAVACTSLALGGVSCSGRRKCSTRSVTASASARLIVTSAAVPGTDVRDHTSSSTSTASWLRIAPVSEPRRRQVAQGAQRRLEPVGGLRAAAQHRLEHLRVGADEPFDGASGERPAAWHPGPQADAAHGGDVRGRGEGEGLATRARERHDLEPQLGQAAHELVAPRGDAAVVEGIGPLGDQCDLHVRSGPWSRAVVRRVTGTQAERPGPVRRAERRAVRTATGRAEW